MLGSPQVINCTVSTVSGVESRSVMISWMGPGGNIYATNGRVSIGSVTAGGNNMYTRSLQFTYLLKRDEGTYTCNVIMLETNASQSVELQSFTSKLWLHFIINLLVVYYSSHSHCNCGCPNNSDSWSVINTAVYSDYGERYNQ